MSIRVRCTCGARLKAPDGSFGKSVRCSVCGNAVFVPKASGEGTVQVANREVVGWLRVVCACGKVIKSPPEWAGKKGHCPRCGAEMIMPAAVPSDASGEHEALEVGENASSDRPLSPMVQAQPETAKSSGAKVKKRSLPRPQPQPDEATEKVEGEERAPQKSGLLDLTGQEEVKIVDGVAPSLWDAKLTQRAKAIKAGPKGQAQYYSSKLVESQSGARAVVRRMRSWAAANRAAPAAVSLVVIVLASFAIYRTVLGASTPPSPWPTVYCYDLNSGKIFAAPKTQLSPFPTDSGGSPLPQPAGVWAAVFACGNCAEPADRFVGWIEALTPEARAGLGPFIADNPKGEPAEGMLENAISNIEGSVKIADPKNPDAWFTMFDPDAATIMNSTPEHCKDGAAPTRCRP